MNLSRYFGKRISPSCQYCLYGGSQGENGEPNSCEKHKKPSQNGGCSAFRYEPTLREPKEPPSPGHFRPEDFVL